MLKIDQKSQEFEFTFDSGEHAGENFIGSIIFCSSPVCDCKDGFVTLKSNPVDTNKNQSEQYSFTIDIELKTVSHPDKIELAVKNFAKSFVKNISKDDWKNLFLNYLWFKTYVTETADLNEIDAAFPDELLNDSATIYYSEILPFCNKIYITIDNVKYLVTEQYCFRPQCKCADVFLSFCPLTKNGVPQKKTKAEFVIECNYTRGTWKLYGEDKNGIYIKPLLDLYMQELKESKKDLFSYFKKRHNNLKELCKRYLKNNKQEKPDRSKLVYGKVTRNSICPCGSGKKYKKCCMNK